MLLDLNPIAFQIGPIAVRWYGIFMALSFLLGSWYLYREGLKKGINEDFLLNLAIIAIFFGVVGARLMFVLANYPDWFVNDQLQILKVYEGGLSWHGGLLGGLLSGWIYARLKRVNVNQLLDMVVPGLGFGYFLVRIANIFNQEVLGRHTDFFFDRWPAQLIGSAIGLILLIRFFYIKTKNPPDGYQFWSFIFYHQILRAVVEETVRNNPLEVLGYVVPGWGLGFFTLTQITTPPILLIAYYFMRRTKANKEFYSAKDST
ncbi:MAG: phosphatidylglycerol---prolipoprotein diacylglyceryl transferase [Clostridia bacterium]|nr:phosphatidylglycerol---prolipoprotein diacylglyceryl transferase [Clostridia bacterium]